MKTSSSEAGPARTLIGLQPALPERLLDGGRASRRADPDVRAVAEHLDVLDAGQRASTSTGGRGTSTTTSNNEPGIAACSAGGWSSAITAPRAAARRAAALGFVQVRRRHHDRQPCGQELRQQLPELAPRHRIDAGRRFVEQQQLRLVDQRAGERELLLHAAGQAVGAAAPGTASAGSSRAGDRARRRSAACRGSPRGTRCSRRWSDRRRGRIAARDSRPHR